MSKNMIYGAGVLGIIAAAVYIYKEHKKAKEEPDMYLDSNWNLVPNPYGEQVKSEAKTEEQSKDQEMAEDTTKKQKKEAVTEKVTSLGHKIGKTLGTAALKFGAKHPKITKFILTGAKYIPYSIIGLVTFATLHKMTHRNSDMIDGSDMIYEMEVNDERFDQPMNMITRGVDPQKSLEVWENSELSSNYQKLYEFLKTLNFVYSEHYIIDDKESFEDTHPDYDVSNVKDNFVIRQVYTVEDVAKRMQQQQ